jgi:hypothetical protein
MPNVFVGHPFGGNFPYGKFRQIFKSLPFKVIYGNTDIQTRHLLDVMRTNIDKCDYAIFDLSDWNSNVALELGLAQGLKKTPGKNYYIILNTKRSHDVPSDIRGIQRVEYTSYDFKPDAGLGDQLTNTILSKEYWIKKIWSAIPDVDKGLKKRLLAVKILAHLREHERLNSDNLTALAKGTHLRSNDKVEVIEVLKALKLVRKIKNTNAYRLGKKIYR